MRKSIRFLDSNMLRALACLLMLCDHMWATIVPGNEWMTWVGRLAFPIFAFQIAEGFLHTSNFRKYAVRLLIFGLVSEVPFDLVYGSTMLYPFHQNVMFTLLLGLLAVKALDNAKEKHTVKAWLVGVLSCCAVLPRSCGNLHGLRCAWRCNGYHVLSVPRVSLCVGGSARFYDSF